MDALRFSAISRRAAKTPAPGFRLLAFLLLSLSSIPRLNAHAAVQEQQPQPLGSLSTVGDVYVNDLRAPAESTIFMGDKLRTGEDGVASFTASGKGTLKFSPNSFAVFAGTNQYVAELRSGTAVLSSLAGPSGFSVRVGDFVAVPAVQEQPTTMKIEKALDGGAYVTCLEGTTSVISLQGASGQLLQTGQAVGISRTGQLTANPTIPGPEPSEPTKPAGTPATQPTPPVTQKKSRKGWIILGVAGGGAAIIAAAAAASGGGHQPVSPSSP